MPCMGLASYPSFYGQLASPGPKPGEHHDTTPHQPIYIPVAPHPMPHRTENIKHTPPRTRITIHIQHSSRQARAFMMHQADGQFFILGPAAAYVRPHPGANSSDMGVIRDAGGDNGASIRLDDFHMMLTRATPAFGFHFHTFGVLLLACSTSAQVSPRLCSRI
jgi:hypothetical protein